MPPRFAWTSKRPGVSDEVDHVGAERQVKFFMHYAVHRYNTGPNNKVLNELVKANYILTTRAAYGHIRVALLIYL